MCRCGSSISVIANVQQIVGILGIFRVLLITLLLCLLIHGRDFRIRREKSVLQRLRMHVGTFLLQGATLTGAVIGAC